MRAVYVIYMFKCARVSAIFELSAARLLRVFFLPQMDIDQLAEERVAALLCTSMCIGAKAQKLAKSIIANNTV